MLMCCGAEPILWHRDDCYGEGLRKPKELNATVNTDLKSLLCLLLCDSGSSPWFGSFRIRSHKARPHLQRRNDCVTRQFSLSLSLSRSLSLRDSKESPGAKHLGRAMEQLPALICMKGRREA